MAWGGNIPEHVRQPGIFIFAASLLLIAAFGVWDYRVLRRKDVVPDILADQFPPQAIFQVGKSHFVFFGEQQGSELVLTCIVQNLYDGANTFALTAQPVSGAHMLVGELPELRITVEPSAVVSASLRMPLRASESTGDVRIRVSGSSRARGRQVRFARRTAVTAHVPIGLTAALAVTGAIVHGGGTFITVPVVAALGATDESSSPSAAWTTALVWEPSASEKLLRNQRRV